MELVLTEKGYAKFLVEFRAEDKRSSSGQGETEVIYKSDNGTETKYYFKAPNFYLMAYNAGGGRVTLTNHTYPDLAGKSINGLEGIKNALRNGGGGDMVMNVNLCKVVAFISEAARSKLVESRMIRLFAGDSVNLKELEFLFKDYGKTSRFVGHTDAAGGYLEWWRPLEKSHYQRYFSSPEARNWNYCDNRNMDPYNKVTRL